MDEVLKSWAVPEGPPMEYGVNRLAMPVDDHDIGYIDIQGTVPQGECGAGQVMTWDDGTYALEVWESGRIQVTFMGKRLTGPVPSHQYPERMAVPQGQIMIRGDRFAGSRVKPPGAPRPRRWPT